MSQFSDLLNVRPEPVNAEPQPEPQPVDPEAPVTAPADVPVVPAEPETEPETEPEPVVVPDPTHTDPVPEVTDPTPPGPQPAPPAPLTEPEPVQGAEDRVVLSDNPEAEAAESVKQPASPSVGPRTSDDRPDRSASMKERHRAALDAVFGVPGAAYEVVKEVHLPEDQRFKTPFGNSGRHGWVIREKNTGQMHTIGASALKIGTNEYKVIDPLPAKRRGRKPREEAAEAPTEVAPTE